MDIMTVETGNIIDCMRAGVPVMQVESGVGSVAFETDERLGRSGQVFQVYQGLEITGHLDALFGLFFNQFFGQILYGQAAGAMTGLTVNQGHARFLFELDPHSASVKEQL